MSQYREPTADECSTHATVALTDTLTGVACWYPQMGGYVGKAIAVHDDDCFDVYVWHDGQFPFSDNDEWRGLNPVELHHCDPDQFVGFGKLLNAIADGRDVTRPLPKRFNLRGLDIIAEVPPPRPAPPGIPPDFED